MVKTVMLNASKLPRPRISGSIWARTRDSNADYSLDAGELETLFRRQTFTHKPHAHKAAAKQARVTLLEPKRENNVRRAKPRQARRTQPPIASRQALAHARC